MVARRVLAVLALAGCSLSGYSDSYGVIECSSKKCQVPQICCLDAMHGDTCVADRSACAGMADIEVDCDDASDCAALGQGAICCMEYQNSTIIRVTCRSSCPEP